MAEKHSNLFHHQFDRRHGLHEASPANRAVIRFYMSPDGNDGSPGTEREPFATLSRAQDNVHNYYLKWRISHEKVIDYIDHFGAGLRLRR